MGTIRLIASLIAGITATSSAAFADATPKPVKHTSSIMTPMTIEQHSSKTKVTDSGLPAIDTGTSAASPSKKKPAAKSKAKVPAAKTSR